MENKEKNTRRQSSCRMKMIKEAASKAPCLFRSTKQANNKREKNTIKTDREKTKNGPNKNGRQWNIAMTRGTRNKTKWDQIWTQKIQQIDQT